MTRRQIRAPSQRQLRVGEEIRHALSEVFGRGELRDPVLAGRSITITEVRISPDLVNATAFVMPLGERMASDQEAELLKALARSAPYLRGKMNRTLYLRRSPNLSFAIDETFSASEHLEGLLRRPEVARDLGRDEVKELAASKQIDGESGNGA